MLITYSQANKCLEQVFGSFFTDFGDFESDFDQIFYDQILTRFLNQIFKNQKPDFQKPDFL